MSPKERSDNEKQLILKMLRGGRKMTVLEIHAELIKHVSYTLPVRNISERLTIMADKGLAVLAYKVVAAKDSLGRDCKMRLYWALDDAKKQNAYTEKHWPTGFGAQLPDPRDFRRKVRRNPWAYAVAVHVAAINQPMSSAT